MIRMATEAAAFAGFMLVIGLCALLGLSGCAGLDPSELKLPDTTPPCVANGVTVRVSLPDGHATKSEGCVETRPYPGMSRPGHENVIGHP